MSFIPSYIKRTATALAGTAIFGACQVQLPDNPFRNPFNEEQELSVAVTEPVKLDFHEIKERGTLRMITRYSSNTYFLHQGLEWGFEYELVKEFAKEQNLALEIVIVGPQESPYDLLNEGKGDILAANYTITPERQKYVTFTRPYNLVNQVLVYSSDLDTTYHAIEDFSGENKPAITVRRNSSYYNRLQELVNEGYELNINVVPNEKDTESLLFDISRGTYEATVADDNIFHAANNYMPGLMQGPVISEKDTIAWAIRKNAPNLETEINRFLYKHFRFSPDDRSPRRSTLLNVLRQKYFEGGPQIAEYYSPTPTLPATGVISPYDDMIRSVADSAGIDWLMISAMVAQETKFNPRSESWAGAVGLMQVIPRFSKVEDVDMLYDEEINLKEGVRIISEHLKHYSYMDSTNQWAFALATYNAGMGHVADARRLAIDMNRNPNEWENVADALMKLMQRRYYKDARYGFCRGIETVRYVQQIMNRYQTYESIMVMREYQEGDPINGVVGMFN